MEPLTSAKTLPVSEEMRARKAKAATTPEIRLAKVRNCIVNETWA